ncbi:MAG: Bifunctional folate synthesis protein [Bacteroidetes bacterium ADurb.Bin141]|nr:MAG: Bifunctional folate synthesis protein [Bacteroidetes bacterium ADurb.Bin141]
MHVDNLNPNSAILLTGSNMGNRLHHLQQAAKSIAFEIGKVEKHSAVYETSAWGNTQQPAFLNQALLIETKLSPDELLTKILHIETSMGRERKVRWESRIIDIDILFYGSEISQNKYLTIPHPEIPNRRFVLEPLNEIVPDLIHPQLNKTIRQLLNECNDLLAVTKLNSHVQK